LTCMTDHDLIAEVGRLAACERDVTASLIAHLAELYARRLHERAGYASLFTYCMGVLGLSEAASYDRMKAAKVARRYPVVLELLAYGRINLTTMRLLAPHLTRENHAGLFAAACGKRKREVQEMLARRFAAPDVPSSVRKVPGTTAVEPSPSAVDAVTVSTAPAASTPPAIAAPPPPLVLPLAADRYRITVTVSGQTCEKLELARDLLRHAIPSGDPAQIVARALDLLVEDLVKRKFAATDRPRAGRASATDSDEPSAEVKRGVYIRDRGRCAFVGCNGKVCGERGFLEFHHIIPRAAGGRPTIDNISLRCRAHNGAEVDLFFGPGKRYLADTNAVAVNERVSDDAFRSGTRIQGQTRLLEAGLQTTPRQTAGRQTVMG